MTAEAVAPAPAAFSDRGLSAPDIGVGFDTVRLRGPARLDLLYALDERRVRRVHGLANNTITKAGWARIRVGQTDVRVNCNSRTGPLEVAVEFSGPMLHLGTNLCGWPLHEITGTTAYVVETLAELLPGFPRLTQMRVIRLDLLRDFLGIQNPTAVLTALAALPCAGRFSQEWRSRRDSPNHVQTLTRRVAGRWRANGYDKLHEQDDLAERRRVGDPQRGEQLRLQPGVLLPDVLTPRLRWEVQLRHRAMADLRGQHGGLLLRSPDLLTEIAATYFHRSEFDHFYRGGTVVFNQLMAELAKTPGGRREAQRVAIYKAAVESGAELLSHNPTDLARRTLRRYGLTAADLLGPEGPPTRLDFETGQPWHPS